MTEKLAKESVDYRRGSGTRNCGNCSMFRPDAGRDGRGQGKVGTCTLVRGHIRAGDYCDRWEGKNG